MRSHLHHGHLTRFVLIFSSVGVLAEIQVAGSQAPCKRSPGVARPRSRYCPRGYPGPIRIGTHNRKPNSEISISHALALAQSSDFCSALPDELTEHLTGPRHLAQCLMCVCSHEWKRLAAGSSAELLLHVWDTLRCQRHWR